MEAGTVRHNCERDPDPRTITARLGFIWFSGFRGKDINVIFYQNMPNLHNRYKSAERKISQKNPEYNYVKLLLAM
jgi:hypothetical protein